MDANNPSLRQVAGMLLTLAAMPCAASAQTDLSLRDYIHTEWTHHEGLPLGEVRSVAQSSDGWLWLVTSEGVLLRFDGMRFVVERDLPCAERVREVRASRGGIVWLVCGSRFVRRSGHGQFEAVTGFSVPRLSGMFDVDADGRPWSFDKTLRYMSPVTRHQVERPVPSQLPIWEAIQDADGAFWMSDGSHVFRMREGETERLAVAGVQCMALAHGGGVLVSANNQVWHLDNGTVRRIAVAPSTITLTANRGCMIDQGPEGVWIGTRQHGMARILNGRIETWSDLSNQRQVVEVFSDRTGTVWAGTTAGLHRFRRPVVQVLSASSVFKGPPYFAFADSTGAIWMGPLEQNRVSRTAANGSKVFIQSSAGPFMAVGEDSMGRVWLSDLRDIGYVANRDFVPVRDSHGAPIPGVRAFVRDERGSFWALARGIGVYQVAPGPPRLVITAPDSEHRFLVSERFGTWIALPDYGVTQHTKDGSFTFRNPLEPPSVPGVNSPGKVQTIVEDGDSIFVGTLSGLRRWRRGRWTDWSSEHGLPGDGYVQEIIADQQGRLWMMSRAGILILPRAQFDATPDGQPRALMFAQVGVLDGVVPHAGFMATWPRVAHDGDGRLLFTTMDSIVRIDPSRTSAFSFTPTVVIDAVTVDNQPLGQNSSRTFVEPSILQFDYTALDLPNPETGRFRFRLEGHDAGWIEAGGRRSVTYGTLRPGRYQFTVVGAGSNGMWNEAGPAFEFRIAPIFWRTWWFRLAALAGLSLLATGAYRLRLRQVARALQIRFEERLAERERVARDLHDTLLQTVQGSKMVVDHVLTRPGRDAEALRAMEQVSVWLGQASKEGRQAVDALRTASSEANDLTDALRRAIEECRRRSPMQLSLSVAGEYRAMHPHVGDDVYRIAYEALRNACTHSGGTRVDIEIVYARDLTLRIADDGVGMEPALTEAGRPGHFGLQGMKERAERIGGTFTLMSTVNGGTTVMLSVPGRIIFLRTPTNVVDRLRRVFWINRIRNER